MKKERISSKIFPLVYTGKDLWQSAIAQLVEQVTVNHPVAGSNPARGAIICLRTLAVGKEILYKSILEMNHLKIFVFLITVLVALLIYNCGCGSLNNSSNTENWVDEGILFNPDTIGISGALGVSDASIIQLANGNLRLFISVNTLSSSAALYSAVSTNETNWTLESGIRLGDVTVSRPVKLSNGNYRLYYNARDNAGIISAISTDEGQTFTLETGTRVATGGAYDLAVVDNGTTLILSNGSYKLYYGGANENGSIIPFNILSAVSSDGLTFSKDSGIRLSSSQNRATHPHVFVYQGQYIMYYSTNSYIYKAVSSDGVSWTESGSTGIQGADVYILQLSNGNWRMFYNTYDASTGKSYLRTAIWRKS